MILQRGNRNQTILFNPTYSNYGVWSVTEGTAILVAEQIRFNTLNLAQAYERPIPSKFSPSRLFTYLWNNFKSQAYNNWQRYSNNPPFYVEGHPAFHVTNEGRTQTVVILLKQLP